MKKKLSRPLAVTLAVSLGLTVVANVGLQAFETQVSSSHGPTGYRGIVAANFYGVDGGEEIIGDFGTLGVWLYHHFGTWVILSSQNPDWIFAVKFADPSDSELIGDFGAKGLWLWDCGTNYSGTWTQLTGANADAAIAVDDDWDGNEEVQVDFGTLGLWRYDYDTNVWTQFSGNNPIGCGLRTDLWWVGWQEGMWNFGDAGLWLGFWNYGGPYWEHIASSQPDDWASANFVDDSGTDISEKLMVDFGGLGTWLFSSLGGWQKISNQGVQAMVPARFGQGIVDAELIIADSSYTPWCWWGGTTWEHLSNSPMETGFIVPYDSDFLAASEPPSEQELAGDFGAQGLWEYNYITDSKIGVWSQLSSFNPVFMVAVDHWGDGKPGELVVNFGPGVGLWIWDSGAGVYFSNWTKMTDSVPDSNLSW